MITNNEIIAKLIEFRDCDKFKVYVDLQPAVANSTEEDKKFINAEMNFCVNEILEDLEKDYINAEKIKTSIKKSIERIEDTISDTEDREFCYELHFKIGEILNIDMEDYSQSIQEHMMGSVDRILKKAGINLDDFLKNNPSQ